MRQIINYNNKKYLIEDSPPAIGEDFFWFNNQTNEILIIDDPNNRLYDIIQSFKIHVDDVMRNQYNVIQWRIVKVLT